MNHIWITLEYDSNDIWTALGFNLNTNYDQGTNSNKIEDVWVFIDDNLQGLFHLSVPQRHCRTATNTVADIALKRGT